MHRGPHGICLLFLSSVTSCLKTQTIVMIPLDITFMGMDIISSGTLPSLPTWFFSTIFWNQGFLCPFLPHILFIGTVIFTLGFLSSTFLGNFGIFRSVVLISFENLESPQSSLPTLTIFSRLMALVFLKLSWIELWIIKKEEGNRYQYDKLVLWQQHHVLTVGRF